MKTLKRALFSPQTIATLAAAMLGAIAGGVLVARATSNGATRERLYFHGKLTEEDQPLQGQQKLTFTFKRETGGAPSPVCTATATVMPDKEGTFIADVGIEHCPTSLFDGSNLRYSIDVGSANLVADQPVAPVPYAKYADHAGSPDCPVGYRREAERPNPANPASILCVRGDNTAWGDHVVKVGVGATAFWIDRYEASVFDSSGRQYGEFNDDYPTGFPKNGKRSPGAAPLFAYSRGDKRSSTYMTWFQAMEACAANGKRLPTDEEWLRAASGTPDPEMASDGSGDGSGGTCNTMGSRRVPNTCPQPCKCVSYWGAQDMIGNVWEWTSQWQATPGAHPNSSPQQQPWPSEYSEDMVDNVFGTARTNPASQMQVNGTPAVTIRGGDHDNGKKSGTFALSLVLAPSLTGVNVGVRCVIPR